jgi:competence protein ComEC
MLRHKSVLAMIAGACMVRDASLGLTMLFFLLLILKSGSSMRKVRDFLLLTAAFCIGSLLVLCSLHNSDVPNRASYPQMSIAAKGRIVAVSGMPGGRIRVILESLQSIPDGDLPVHVTEILEKSRTKKKQTVHNENLAASMTDEGRYQKYFLPGKTVLTLDSNALEHCRRPVPGMTFCGLMRLYPVHGSRNPGVRSIVEYWQDQGIIHTAYLQRSKAYPVWAEVYEEGTGSLAGLRERWRSILENMLKLLPSSEINRQTGQLSQAQAMILALLFGDRSALSLHTVDLFTRAGLVHSLALSGQHLALAGLAGFILLFLFQHLYRRIYLLSPKNIEVFFFSIPFALIYLFLGNAPFSLIRAAVMMIVAAVWIWQRVSYTAIDVLLGTVFLLFVSWPLSVFDLSAQLSVLAVAGILLFLPLLESMHRRYITWLRITEEMTLGNKEWKRSNLSSIFISRRDTNSSDIKVTGKHVLLLIIRKFLLVCRSLVWWGISLLLISCIAQLAVMPVLVTCFGAVSPCFWLNIIWLPLLSLVILPGAACGFFLLLIGQEWIASLLLSAAIIPAESMLSWLEILNTAGLLPMIQCFRPSAITWLGYEAVLLGIILLFQSRKREKRRFCAGMICLGLLCCIGGLTPVLYKNIMAKIDRQITLKMLDVGQGQSIILEYPGGRLLVDGGGSASSSFDCGKSIVAPVLTDGHFPRLEAVVVSHTDIDHARGLRWILEHFSVQKFCWSEDSAMRAEKGEGYAIRRAAENKIPEEIWGKGDRIALTEGLYLEVLWPEKVYIPNKNSGNDASLVLRLVRNGKGLVLLCGDMGASALRKLVRSGQNLQAEVLVLPHHGSASSLEKKLYDAVQPERVLFSAAEFNAYGFPAQSVLEEWQKRGIPCFGTAAYGGLSVVWKNNEQGRFQAGW